ncbi:helix-turn-helix transcriptional regulator [Mucilaginibacter rubeus]|uniref:Helix-turn-helix transcriptional regulator n=1 Tax=Mucilaginibacter rubeus TaxID=2027860 RepID=A0AAE6JH07_9SPHI|nr:MULTISPECIES: helix-turn-helix transcriptional regulator [Mucilaginibacter]QEM05396.1 helix-turn-helix transcriptional regulator [Mucilaginibacter rubeus]QEM17984.1 helix-turn-helix transcriptional regulator [Mucilaginibacter gossypii]QTE45482.1 helix-turn-helix transcriptional regulator [Mucilaginibacter rubeus]QTE52079.1 helix-turn-helix transcriptional regulator [Mucilaginibacter rubeus]QTE57167.1 helix-turn-helix transcriptional regulator [Mucilaginibacter rubeus]
MDKTFTQKLSDIQSIADDLPSALIIHEVETLQIVYMNSVGLDILGTTLDELQAMGPETYHVKYFNTEDSNEYVPKILHLIKSKTQEQVSYFQQVRVPDNPEWQLFVSNTKVFARNEAGDAAYLLTIASRLDPVHHITTKVNRLMNENAFLRHNNLLFLTLTRREKEILKYIAMGMSSAEISAKLFIAPATAETHRKNIKNKLHLKNNYDAVMFAQAYNLV